MMNPLYRLPKGPKPIQIKPVQNNEPTTTAITTVNANAGDIVELKEILQLAATLIDSNLSNQLALETCCSLSKKIIGRQEKTDKIIKELDIEAANLKSQLLYKTEEYVQTQKSLQNCIDSENQLNETLSELQSKQKDLKIDKEKLEGECQALEAQILTEKIRWLGIPMGGIIAELFQKREDCEGRLEGKKTEIKKIDDEMPKVSKKIKLSKADLGLFKRRLKEVEEQKNILDKAINLTGKAITSLSNMLVSFKLVFENYAFLKLDLSHIEGFIKEECLDSDIVNGFIKMIRDIQSTFQEAMADNPSYKHFLIAMH